MAKLDVLYQFSDVYAPFAGVSLTTLFENNQDIEQLTVYLAAKDISEENKRLLCQLAQQYNRELVYLNVDNIYKKIEQLGVKSWNGSLATWMKLFVVDDLPDSVEKILYIDSDTLVQGSLSALATLDLGDYPIAAVIDSLARGGAKRLGLSGCYYNGGVIFINVAYWKAHATQNGIPVFLKENHSRYFVADQDLLNDYFQGNILQLLANYNLQGIHYIYKDNTYFSVLKWPKERYYSRETIAQAREDVRIVHFFRFCGEYPWQPGNVHPCRQMYEEARDKSLWKDYRYPPKPLKTIFRAERMLYKFLPQKLFLRLHLYVSK